MTWCPRKRDCRTVALSAGRLGRLQAPLPHFHAVAGSTNKRRPSASCTAASYRSAFRLNCVVATTRSQSALVL